MELLPMINLKNLPFLFPHSVNWTQFFNTDYPVDLEIGFGRTHFFFDRVMNYPDRNIVGIEWKYAFVKQAQRRIEREHLKNAAVFHGNAWLLVPLLFSTKSISQIFVNFPDPWWKTRHKKRLVLNEIFLEALTHRMKPDGVLLLQTDVLELFLGYQKLLSHHGFRLDDTIKNMEIVHSTNATSHREKKCLEQGLPIYRGVFRLV
jgi:tRNA (guanine-N7-)-methyltransferase